jgi:hypothetical protein
VPVGARGDAEGPGLGDSLVEAAHSVGGSSSPGMTTAGDAAASEAAADDEPSTFEVVHGDAGSCKSSGA